MPQFDSSVEHFETGSPAWKDACLAIDLASVMVASQSCNMPTFCIKAQAGPVLDAWLKRFEKILPAGSTRRLQATSSFNDLIGGLDLSATLAAGRRIYETGLLSQCRNGTIIIPLSGPMMSDLASGLGAVLDSGKIPMNGSSPELDTALDLGIVIIDQSEPGEEFLPEGMRDRMVFHLDLNEVTIRDIVPDQNGDDPNTRGITPALCDARLVEELCALSLGFGLTSIRPSRQALQLACLHAGIHGRKEVDQEDVMAAIRLSLINRATMLPPEEMPEETIEETQSRQDDERTPEVEPKQSNEAPQDMDVSTVLATLPPELLAALSSSVNSRRGKRLAGRSGGKSVSYKRGRPIASMRGELGHGKRLDLIATLRASAPWQTMRREQRLNPNRIQIRKRDFHVKRYVKPSESTTIFVVDASGSTAVNRLGEAKGAVELLLGESYSRRDHVALISLRGAESELILPPTRSLARARKTLSALRGGGGTPLAHGLQKAMLLTQDELRKGRTPNLVLLTDGSANIALGGQSGRAKAMEEALVISTSIASLSIGIIVIDVSRSSSGHAKKIADAMQANHVPMPFASAKNISDAVRVGQA